MLQIVIVVKFLNWMANSVDPDKTSRNEPSHQDLHCLLSICFSLQVGKGYKSNS